MPRFNRLEDWLAWQENLHSGKIDLGLERVGRVANKLFTGRPAPVVITVAGTNGKGSSCALLEALYLEAGYRVGKYTSPHLLRYNERISVNGEAADDEAICTAFASVDVARGDTSLTYFEFGTLAALDIFSRSSLDVAVLEVGMGGRLDAVNIVDPDVALVTAIGMDHTEWLGPDRETIGREKAGIFRAGIPAVCSDPAAPASVKKAATDMAAHWYAIDEAFCFRADAGCWDWEGPGTSLRSLPLPAMPGRHQLENAAGVLMVADLLQERCLVERPAIEAALRKARLPGRCQFIVGAVEQVLDVAHNAESAATLRHCLQDRPAAGRTRVVIGMLADKPVGDFVRELQPVVDGWLVAGLPGDRGLPADRLAPMVEKAAGISVAGRFDGIREALDAAMALSASGDRVVVCGSFLSVAEAMASTV